LDVDEAIRLLQAIKELGGDVKQVKATAKKTVKTGKKVAKKVKRAPSAYNKYMKKQLAILKKKHPKTSHTVLFKKAAKSWKRSPERKRSMK
jgi:ABC-type branched-subunit amino acid transport system substrate-binding protein